MASSVRWWFGGLITALLTAALVRFLLAESLADDLNRTISEVETAREANDDVLQALTDIETGVRGYQLTKDRRFLEPAVRGRAQYARAMALALRHTPDRRAGRLLRAEQSEAGTWLSGVATPIMAAPPSELSANKAVSETGRQLFDAVRAANADAGKAIDQSKIDELASARTASRLAAYAGFALSLLTSLCALIVARMLSRSLVSPLLGLRRTLVRLASGDRAARAPEAGPPEIREVIRRFNEMCDETDRMREAKRRRMMMQSHAHEIGARIRESLLTEQVLDEVAEALGMALSLDRVYVHLDAGRPSDRQWSRADLPTLPPLPPDLSSPAGTVIRAAAAPDDPLARAAGAGAYVSAPFGFNEEVFGTVILVSAREREWLPDEVDLIDAVCADLGRVFQAVRLYEHERQLVDRLRELDQHKTDFIATVSHELRTPLTSVLGYVEVLTSGEAGLVTERQLKSLRIIERNAERLGEMVADLLTLSRIESGTFALQLRPMRVLEAVQRAVEAIMPLASGVGLSVSVDVPDELWTAADLPQLQRIVANLLGNAVKFSRRGGEVHVRAHGGENTVVLEIVDDGDGVPQHELAALFEPFQRGSNAVVNATPGPGLGLAVVRSIVEQHHGHARLTSTPGQGTTVTIVLPRICPPPAAQDNVQAVAGSA